MKQKLLILLVFIMACTIINTSKADASDTKDSVCYVEIQDDVEDYIQERVSKHLEIVIEHSDKYGVNDTSDLAIGKAIPVFKVSENYETVYIDKYIVPVLNNGEIILSYFAIYKEEEKGVYSAHGLTADLKYIIEEEKESCLIEYDSSVLVATNDGYRYLSDISTNPICVDCDVSVDLLFDMIYQNYLIQQYDYDEYVEVINNESSNNVVVLSNETSNSRSSSGLLAKRINNSVTNSSGDTVSLFVSQYINAKYQPLCWAASVATTINLMAQAKSINIEFIAEDIGFVPSDSTTYPKYPPSFVAKLINKYTIYGYKAVEGTISSTVIRNRINKGKPVVLYCVSENNYKHYITVYGYCDYGEVLEYYDSADDNKDQQNTMDVSLKKMYSKYYKEDYFWEQTIYQYK